LRMRVPMRVSSGLHDGAQPEQVAPGALSRNLHDFARLLRGAAAPGRAVCPLRPVA
jgi:hypothetical protein